MQPPLPSYSAETLSRQTALELIRLMSTDEDRVPRHLIEECARRGEEMVRALEELAGAASFWERDVAPGEWWLRLHAAMILGLIASERAGVLLVSLMRAMERSEDENLQDWLSGYWPALFRNKPESVVPALRELAQERGVDWFTRIEAMECVLALAERRGRDAFEAAIDWVAAIATQASDDPMLRWCAGAKLLDFPRERHRGLAERLAREQTGSYRDFDLKDVSRAYAAGRDEPHWRRFGDPWHFYAPQSIAERQERWAREDAEADSADDESPLEDLPQPYMREMPKVGRNDPCPCGSGKKYKRCCLVQGEAEPVENLTWQRLSRLLDEHKHDMLRFVTQVYGPAAIQEAWQYFVSDSEAAFDPRSRHLQLFVPWFYHRWSPDHEDTRVRDRTLHGVSPTAEYLRRKKQLAPLLREYLESCLISPFTAFEILRADPGRGLRVKDLFTGSEHEVSERSASATMQQDELIIGQVAQAGGVALLEAAPGFAIPPIWKIQAIKLRMERFSGAVGVAAERLREVEGALITLYHDIAEETFSRKLPAMQNTDGEPVSLRRVVFDVPSAQEAFDALKHLSLAGADDELLKKDARRAADGSLSGVKFSWLKKGNAQLPAWENTVLGSIEIDGTRLVAEVNSEERERRLCAIVDEALGGRARHRATEIQSLEMLAEAPARSADASESDRLAELPDVKAKLAEMMASHFEHWVNQNIPVLGGRTPLEAVKDQAGREAVAALVAQVERDGKRMKPPLDPAIPRRLRERLGLQ